MERFVVPTFPILQQGVTHFERELHTIVVRNAREAVGRVPPGPHREGVDIAFASGVTAFDCCVRGSALEVAQAGVIRTGAIGSVHVVAIDPGEGHGVARVDLERASARDGPAEVECPIDRVLGAAG